ncbi:glutathione peroxidase [Prevotella sp. A2931]|uniref:Glutathione peroxidase n=1 Tax=Prevotella illustrans TaxID=2800387 RepID=A0ABS3M6S9_9BACT|nr:MULTISPECIES: glutathione peroxidase [Prevotella]MBO1363883.1 glutathione peroxidase [Prevotella illustrans]PTL26297.1 glutathione peroxidase [Prevotella sp. oral taxon 820]
MKNILLLLMTVFALTASAQKNIYGFKVTNDEDKQVSLKQYKGKVLLIVNTATQCGFTPQYAELEALYRKYHDQGLEILDFPCNQFDAQAPGTIQEIRKFCTDHYAVTFPQFAKIDVNGSNETPLYTYLKKQAGFKGFGQSQTAQKMDQMMKKRDADYTRKADIKWNFTKFLVDSKGKVVGRFEPTADMKQVEEAIAPLLRRIVESVRK